MSVQTRESIYNLIPDPLPPKVKSIRHKSKFNDTVRQETKYYKTNNKTMGPANVPLNQPKIFLKKHSKEPKLPEKSSFSYSEERKPAVPKHSERPQMAEKTSKNFITTNAVSNILAVPTKPTPKYVDSPFGAAHNLEGSGLMPLYTHKTEYGKVPVYIEKRKKEMAEAQTEYEKYIQESFERGQMKKLHHEERQVMLDGLKKNWEQLHHEYQGLSVVTDTPAKKARKERMEAEMKQLEKDIELIERHPVIYVENPSI